MASGKRVLVLCDYNLDTDPGQRFRWEQYLDVLRQAGFDLRIEPFYSSATQTILYRQGYTARKVAGVALGYLRRAALMTSIRDYDWIFLYREAAPLGPPIFEAIVFKLGCKVIYDFDDAIFEPTEPISGGRLTKILKYPKKVQYIVRNSWRVSVSTKYLQDWASRFKDNVMITPTTIGPNYFSRRKRHQPDHLPVIGWSGSRSTAKYLSLVRDVLKELQNHHEFEFIVICNHDPGFGDLRHYTFIPWNSRTEVDDLLKLNIGIMPQFDGPFDRGKAGLKAMQYSALGIVPVVSPTGGGEEVVRHQETGVVVKNNSEGWYTALDGLLNQPESWARMGESASQFVLERFSMTANIQKYLSLFKD